MSDSMHDRSRRVLEETVESLRKIISDAAIDERMEAVMWLVDLTNQIENLRQGDLANVNITKITAGDARKTRPATTSKVAIAGRDEDEKAIEGTYPRFISRHDLLVKVGWSKKRNAEYEHRATKTTIEMVYEEIRQLHATRLFTVESLTPIIDAKHGHVPSYQVYLALAWLQHVGYLIKHGRNSYRINRPHQDFETLWNFLSEE